MTEHDNNKKITFGYKNEGEFNFHGLACTTELDSSGEGSFWRMKIDKSSDDGWLFMGITGNLDFGARCYNDSTCFGWFPYGSIKAGVEVPISEERPNSTNFSEGGCLYFRFKAKKLSMHRVQEKKTFSFDIIGTDTTKFYIHFIFTHDGTVASLESLNAEERAVFTDND